MFINKADRYRMMANYRLTENSWIIANPCTNIRGFATLVVTVTG